MNDKTLEEQYVDLVDDKDKVVDQVIRKNIYSPDNTHRVVNIIVVNPNDEVFIGKRTKDRFHYPGRFQDIGGIVESGESYEDSAIKELEQELGITGNLIDLGVFNQRTEVDNSNIATFVLEFDGDLNVDEREFESYNYIRDFELLDNIENKESFFTPATAISLKEYFKYVRTHKVSAPGKIFISGEWGVLRKNNPSVVGAVDNKVKVYVKKSKDSKLDLSIKDFDIENLRGEIKDSKLEFEDELDESRLEHTNYMKNAIETVSNYLEEIEPFSILSAGEKTSIKVNGEVKKFGFGSSAASTVAIISALLRFHSFDINDPKVRDIIYKLSAISNYFAQGKVGSGFDIASSTFGGIISYKRFDPVWLETQLTSQKSIRDIVKENWEDLFIEQMKVLPDMDVLVGWTQKSASTSKMIKELYSWRDQNEETFEDLFDRIASVVNNLIFAWKGNNKERILKYLRLNRNLLSELTQKSGVSIEIDELARLAEIVEGHGGAGKLAGAGGGDIGIAVVFDKETKEKIKKDWKKSGIIPLDTKLYKDGVRSVV